LRFYLAGNLYPASNPYPDGEWRPRFSMIFEKPVPLDPPAQSGAYAAVIFDDKGQELVRQPFDASFEEPDDGLKPPFIPLDLLLPFPAGAHRVQVLHGDKVLYETVRPGSGPAIDWVKAAVVDGVAHVTWQAQHPTAPLRFALDFSADDGKTRTRLASGIDATSYDWNTELAPGTEVARLILVASDGFHTVEAMTESFSIPRRAPVARISAPEHQGARTVAGRPLELRGSGFDLNDGLLAGKSLRWTSSLNGLLGSGASLTVSLMPGQHLLTLEAISSAELVGSDTIDLVVLADGDGDGLPDAYENEYSACLDGRERRRRTRGSGQGRPDLPDGVRNGGQSVRSGHG
jgi:hypothetical protein